MKNKKPKLKKRYYFISFAFSRGYETGNGAIFRTEYNNGLLDMKNCIKELKDRYRYREVCIINFIEVSKAFFQMNNP